MYLSSKVASLNDDIDKRRQEYQSFRSKYSNDVPLGVSKSKSKLFYIYIYILE